MDRLTPDSISHPGASRTAVISDAQFTSARLLTGQWQSIGVAIHSQIALGSTELPGASPTLLQLHERVHWEWADPNLRGMLQLGPDSLPMHDAADPTRREAFSAELIHVARGQLLIAPSLSPAS